MKKAQFNFVWLFALFVGGAILVFAIFGAMKAGDTMRFQSDTEIAKSISIITDPMQASFGEGSFGKITFSQETRINNICFSGQFGKNDISVATKSDVGEEWNLAGGATSIHNKYIFSSEKNTGEEYYVFSKPFDFPYEVSDLIFLTPKDYCFIGAPGDIADEIIGLNIPNIKIENCTVADAIKVCFGGGSNCDIEVYGSCSSGCNSAYDSGTVVKDSVVMNYVGNLMYAAIFSDKLIYDCNVERLMYRTAKIAEELVSKTDLMDIRGCNTNMKADLIMWRGLTLNADSGGIVSLRTRANEVERKNDRELCSVWE
ncbi:MAG: hypothetical protein OEL87_00615 [Nanoarchaeota archaeon]|nr:hypothetical protein [Nanoarchaeota archaeon]